MSENALGCIATISNLTGFTLHRTEVRRWTENGDGNGGPWWEPEPPATIGAQSSTTFGNGLNAWVNCCGSVTYQVRADTQSLFEFTAFWRITPPISPAPHAIDLFLGDAAKGLVNFYWEPAWRSKRLTSYPKPTVRWTLKEWPE